MSKLVSVAHLMAGDRFEFIAIGDKFAGSPGKDQANMMVVANVPKVNRAANSCFFRYKAEADPLESRSFNGTAEIEVRLYTEHSPIITPAADPTPPASTSATVATPPVADSAAERTSAERAVAEPKKNGHPVAAPELVAPPVDTTAVAEDEAEASDESSESESSEEEDAVPAKSPRKKAAAKTAVGKKPTKAAATKSAAPKKKTAKSAAVAKPTVAKAAAAKPAVKKAAKPAAKKKV